MNYTYEFNEAFNCPTQIILTPDEQYIFAATCSENNYGGALKQFSTKEPQNLLKDYGIIHSTPIIGIFVSTNSRFLFTCAKNGELIMFFVPKYSLAKKFDIFYTDCELSMVRFAKDFSCFFIVDQKNNFKHYLLRSVQND